jgi:peptidyl-prolyl cis-trans isomerase D
VINVYGLGKDKRTTNIILWAVVASLAIGSLSTIVFAPSTVSQVKIARVNGAPIYFERYRKELVSLQEQLSSMKQMAKMYGLPEEMVLQAYGFDNPQVKALDNCVREVLYDQVKKSLAIRIDQEWFKQELLKSMPQFVGQDGRFNSAMYANYLQRLSMKPAEFEERRAEEMQRDMVYKFLQQTAYVPGFIASEAMVRDEAMRSFSVATIKLDHFAAQAKKMTVDDKELEAFYLTNKENYRIPEKRSATYWELDTKKVSGAIEIDEASVQSFYEKNKATTYRIAPKVKVRRIVIKKDQALAAEVLKKAQAQQADFAALVKQYSQDAASAEKGGIVDLSVKGTHDPEFEKAAFRLKTKNELSPVVRTKLGYEIIQLVDRVNASEKPLESVRAEIVAALKAKRGMGHIRSELERLTRSAKDDESALADFVKKHGLVAQQTPALTEADTKADGAEGLLAKKLFSNQNRASGIGYFADADGYVIFKPTTIKKSFISSFDDIKNIVATDYVEDQAKVLARRALKEAYASVLAGEKSLQDVANSLGGHYSVTSAAVKAKDLKEFDSEKNLKERLFSLTAPEQVLFVATDKNFYLAKINTMAAVKESDFAAKRTQYAKKEAARIASLQAGAFIASLHRNAKIEVEDKRLLDMQPEPERD